MNKPEHRNLSASELEKLYTVIPANQWNEPTIKLIWERCCPPEAQFEDFVYFMYNCHQRGLNPLLSEAYLRLNWDSDSGGYKPIIIVGIGGMLKKAGENGLLDGISTICNEQDGRVISASTQVFKRDCGHAFEATVYFDEYCSRKKGGEPTRMWATKPRIMLGKCSEASALRKAFAAELAGCYAPEEFERSEPDSNFLVEGTGQPASSDLREKRGTSGTQTSGSRREPDPPKEAAKPKPTSPPPTNQEKASQSTVRQQLIATKQRLCEDLSIPKDRRKATLDDYFRGFLGLPQGAELPREPERYVDALATLDLLALTDPEVTKEAVAYHPFETGGAHARIKTDWLQLYVSKQTSRIAYQLARAFKFETPEDLETYLQANDMAGQADVTIEAFLRFALIDRTLASDIAGRENPLATMERVEDRLGGRLENFSLAAIKAALEPVEYVDEPAST